MAGIDDADITSAQETIAGVSSTDLFRGAVADEAPPAEQQPTPQPPEQQPPEQQPSGAQPRDELGRYAARQEQQAPAAAIQQPAPLAQPGQQQPLAGDDGAMVPSWRHRELREQRDASEARARQIEAMYLDQQRQLQTLQQRFQEPPKPETPPDVIADPDAYYRHLQTGFQQQMRNMEANFSFRLAHQATGELFEHAYGEMIGRAERGDPTVVRAVMQSPDPGAAMINWYRREMTLAKVGNDPDAWFEQQLGERLKDQKFAGGLLERMRGGAQQAQQANGQGGPVQLPPSLNRMAAAAPNKIEGANADGDMSDASLFNYAFRANRGA
jgi:hypothetical protein